MSDHLIAEADRHAMALPTTHPTHADIAWYVRELSELATERDQLRAECNNLRADLDAIKAIRDEEMARAERAEAILGKLQELHGCSQEMIVHWCEHAAQRSCGLDQMKAELAAERARQDWLGSGFWITGEPCDRAAIDAAMKEKTK